MPATERFIQEVRDVDPDATGNPMQIYEASRQMKRSYEMAAIYAMIIVCMVVYLDFGSLRCTLLALLPLGLGMLQLFGLMGLVNVPLNSANMIVLPLILGIGVDNGVHIVHDFRRQPRGSYHISNSTRQRRRYQFPRQHDGIWKSHDRQPSGIAEPRAGAHPWDGVLSDQRVGLAQPVDAADAPSSRGISRLRRGHPRRSAPSAQAASTRAIRLPHSPASRVHAANRRLTSVEGPTPGGVSPRASTK